MNAAGVATPFRLRIAGLPHIGTTTHHSRNLTLTQFVDIDWVEINLAVVAHSVNPSITPREFVPLVVNLKVPALLECVEVFTYLAFSDGDLSGDLIGSPLLEVSRGVDDFTHPR